MVVLLKIDKKSLQNILTKAICQKGKEVLLESNALRIQKNRISFMKIEGESVASFGKFEKDFFKTLEVNKEIELVIDAKHISNLKYIRTDPITIEQKESKVYFTSSDDIIDVSITSEEKYNDEFEKYLIMETIDKNTFPLMRVSKNEKIPEDSPDYTPVYAHLILDVKDITGLPDCDSIILKGEGGKVYVNAIEFGEGKLTNYQRTLKPREVIMLEDEFEIRIDKQWYDLVMNQFSSIVNMTISKKYIMFMEVKKGQMYGYMIGLLPLDAESITGEFAGEIEELSELEDVDEESIDQAISEVKSTKPSAVEVDGGLEEDIISL